jgi:hypothetical protein
VGTKIKDEQLPEIAAMLARGDTHQEVADAFGLTRHYVTMMVTGERRGAFQKYLLEAKEALRHRAQSLLDDCASDAVEALKDALASEKGAAKVKAAETLLKFAFPQDGPSITVNNGPQLPAEKVQAFLAHTAESEGGPDDD